MAADVALDWGHCRHEEDKEDLREQLPLVALQLLVSKELFPETGKQEPLVA